MTLHCFQVASSCIFPSIMWTPLPSGIASITFLAKITSSAGQAVIVHRDGTYVGVVQIELLTEVIGRMRREARRHYEQLEATQIADQAADGAAGVAGVVGSSA